MESGSVGFVGGAPVVIESGPAINTEKIKYEKMWEHEEYRRVSPGESVSQTFLAQARPKPGSTVIDFGCGTGRGGLMLAILGGMKVTLMDFASNCLDPELAEAVKVQPNLKFVEHNLWHPVPVEYASEYGFCCDMMEHVPEHRIARVMMHMLAVAQHCFFQISTVPDGCGKLIGETLHLTVRPYTWWLEVFKALDCVIHWSVEVDGACMFYVTAWSTGKDVSGRDHPLTESMENIKENVRINIANGWTQVVPHPTNDVDVMILGGGPSLNEFEQEIKDQRAADIKLVTLNGAYNWALEHGLVPSATLVVDARPFNERFTHPVVDACKYIIASQVHPSVFEGLPKDRTWIWHTASDEIADILKAQYGADAWWPVPGGSTILLRAIPLLRMLGFKRFHLYGCDSCVREVKPLSASVEGNLPDLVQSPYEHHAYEQGENDSKNIIPVIIGGRQFFCHPGHIAQAQQFMDLIKYMGNEIELQVHGDGLLAHILNLGAELAEKELFALT